MSITVYELEDIRMKSEKMCYEVYDHLRQDKQYKDVKLVKTHTLSAHNSSCKNMVVYHGDISPGKYTDRVFIIGHDAYMSGVITYRPWSNYASNTIEPTVYMNYTILVINLNGIIVNKGFTLTVCRKETPLIIQPVESDHKLYEVRNVNGPVQEHSYNQLPESGRYILRELLAKLEDPNRDTDMITVTENTTENNKLSELRNRCDPFTSMLYHPSQRRSYNIPRFVSKKVTETYQVLQEIPLYTIPNLGEHGTCITASFSAEKAKKHEQRFFILQPLKANTMLVVRSHDNNAMIEEWSEGNIYTFVCNTTDQYDLVAA